MKPRLMGLVVALGLFTGASGFGATARELLTSPAQSIRDVGAQILRGSFVPPPRTNWEALVASLKLGMKESAVAQLLSSAGATNDADEFSANQLIKTYRVDDLWVVRCWFTNAVPGKSEGGLSGEQLVEDLKYVSVEPPPYFNGDWVTYWANGETNVVSQYFNGMLDGAVTSYYPNGSLADVSYCLNGVLDGEATAYYPSGRMECKGQYRDGKQVGHWIWYRKDGTVESEKDFAK